MFGTVLRRLPDLRLAEPDRVGSGGRVFALRGVTGIAGGLGVTGGVALPETDVCFYFRVSTQTNNYSNVSDNNNNNNNINEKNIILSNQIKNILNLNSYIPSHESICQIVCKKTQHINILSKANRIAYNNININKNKQLFLETDRNDELNEKNSRSLLDFNHQSDIYKKLNNIPIIKSTSNYYILDLLKNNSFSPFSDGTRIGNLPSLGTSTSNGSGRGNGNGSGRNNNQSSSLIKKYPPFIYDSGPFKRIFNMDTNGC